MGLKGNEILLLYLADNEKNSIHILDYVINDLVEVDSFLLIRAKKLDQYLYHKKGMIKVLYPRVT